MMYLIIDRATTEWLVQKKIVLSKILEVAETYINSKENNSIKIAVGPIIIALSKKDKLVFINNRELSYNKSDNSIGIIKLTGDLGLLENKFIRQEVFERSLNIVKARLNNYLIDGSYIHRSYANGAHTCISGRGSNARQYNLAFFEQKSDSNEINAIVIIGPEHKFDILVNSIKKEVKEIDYSFFNLSSCLNAIKEYIDFTSNHNSKDIVDVLLSSLGLDTDVESSKYEVHTTTQDDKTIYKYNEYIENKLIGVQRKIFESNILYRSPLRVLGPAGSGKTLLMQLLSMKIVYDYKKKNQSLRCLYLVHNNEMVKKVKERFMMLDSEIFSQKEQCIEISTLYSYAINELEISYESVIDKDAFDAKIFQQNELVDSIYQFIEKHMTRYDKLQFFRPLVKDAFNINNYSSLIMNEISSTIKGQGLVNNREKYIFSEKALSQFHGLLNQYDREFLFDVFDDYNNRMFNDFTVLDTDDIAISLLSRLKTPLWEMQRKTEGYDFIFIDEAQLFNENERKLFALLSNKKINTHIPVAIALDAAQDLYNQFSFGMHDIGFKQLANENLDLIHRSTKEIMDLAFFIIQKSTSLFTPEFPNFTIHSKIAKQANTKLDLSPSVLYSDQESINFTKYLFKKVINNQKKSGIKSIAIICFNDAYWDQICDYSSKNKISLDIIETRGISVNENNVVLSRPQFIGGQEFECIILVGLEQGVYPPEIIENVQLQSTIEEQFIRELYLSITRAKNRVLIVINSPAKPNQIIRESIEAKKITRGEI